MKGIDNQDNVGESQDLHTGIDNQGTSVKTVNDFGIPKQNQMGGNPMTGGSMDNNIINQINNTPINPNKNAITTTFGNCSQCGMSHPPIRPGETCPNASVQSQTSNTAVKITDQQFNTFLVNMKNILISQLDQIKVTNPQEIFKHLTLKMMEALEGLKEK